MIWLFGAEGSEAIFLLSVEHTFGLKHYVLNFHSDDCVHLMNLWTNNLGCHEISKSSSQICISDPLKPLVSEAMDSNTKHNVAKESHSIITLVERNQSKVNKAAAAATT